MAKKANNAVALTSSSTANDAVSAIKAQLEQLKEITGSEFKSGGKGTVQGFPNSIQDETNIENLVRMYSSVNGKENAYNNAISDITAEFPGFKAPVFKEGGCTASALKSDIVLQAKILSVKERKEYLEGLLKKAEEFLTKEDKMKSFLAELQSGLGAIPAALLAEA